MNAPRVIAETPPWAWVTLAGLAVLAGVDALRRAGMAGDSVLLGSLPNLVAAPVLTFGFLTVFYPTREHAPALRRPFAVALPVVVAVILVWELLQLRGNLVFDPIDLGATLLGAGLTVALFRYAIERDDRREAG
jgi:hypothetical protein